jgi:hypothetical protein
MQGRNRGVGAGAWGATEERSGHTGMGGTVETSLRRADVDCPGADAEGRAVTAAQAGDDADGGVDGGAGEDGDEAEYNDPAAGIQTPEANGSPGVGGVRTMSWFDPLHDKLPARTT